MGCFVLAWLGTTSDGILVTQFLVPLVVADVAVWAAGMELVLEEFGRHGQLPARIELCGGGSHLPQLAGALRDPVFASDLPFVRPPTIGVIERLLIATLVLAGGVAAVGLVIAAKTIARFRQLEDRLFAEYYLLGTLASVSLAVITSLIAQLALA